MPAAIAVTWEPSASIGTPLQANIRGAGGDSAKWWYVLGRKAGPAPTSYADFDAITNTPCTPNALILYTIQQSYAGLSMSFVDWNNGASVGDQMWVAMFYGSVAPSGADVPQLVAGPFVTVP